MDKILLNETFKLFGMKYISMQVRFLISHIGLVKLLSQITHDPYGVCKHVCEAC